MQLSVTAFDSFKVAYIISLSAQYVFQMFICFSVCMATLKSVK